ncbi:MAG TPA: PQQ-binding-like beta-propeller repeat protein [Gaiellaceae bacterium]|nr:PQQ-binding-like beta-propeller repeat protein [Gaiellaceae bacterium]
MQRGGRLGLAGLIAVVLVSGSAGAASPPGWTTYGGDPARKGFAAEALSPRSVKTAFVLPIRGRVISQVLAARDVPGPGLTTLYVATSAGHVYAVSETGYVRWRVDLGQLANECAQLDGYGVGGTPVIDPAIRTLYVADALGRLHALDLATGAERQGWPVTVFSDPAREYVWGALAFAHGRVYVPTGSYCDAGPFVGKVIAVDTSTRGVSTWTAVPPELGGGGAVWGWGGVAFDQKLDRLFVVTGNAFEGGSNKGDDFSEAAGLGESIVALTPDLSVVGANHPESIDQPLDLDFVGSPVIFERPGCGALVVGVDKNAQVFGWRADDVGKGPLWTIDLEKFDPKNPVLGQLAYDPQRSALYAVTGARIVRVDVRADCSAAVRWSRALGTESLNGSPTIAGDGTIWFALSGTPRLVAVEPESARTLVTLPLPGLTVTAPTILDGRIFVGTFTGQLLGLVSSGARPVAPGPPAAGAPGHSSWLDARRGWVSRETGVWSTDDGGRHWRRIFAQPAAEVVRTSARAGAIRVATVARGCACAYDLWTRDGGRHWTPTRAIAGGLTGRGASLYWIASGGTSIQAVSQWPPAGGPIRSRTVATVEGTVVSLALVPGGVAGLVRAVSGAASVVVVRGADKQSVDLPAPPGSLVTASLSASGDQVIVDGTVFSEGRTARVRWTSTGDSRAWQAVSD